MIIKHIGILFLISSASALVIPLEIASLIGQVFNFVPPIKKGSDNRYGIGFRLGNHADFQTIIEFGPQRYTKPLGNSIETSSNQRRNTGFKENSAKIQFQEQMKQLREANKLKRISKTKSPAVNHIENKPFTNLMRLNVEKLEGTNKSTTGENNNENDTPLRISLFEKTNNSTENSF